MLGQQSLVFKYTIFNSWGNIIYKVWAFIQESIQHTGPAFIFYFIFI